MKERNIIEKIKRDKNNSKEKFITLFFKIGSIIGFLKIIIIDFLSKISN